MTHEAGVPKPRRRSHERRAARAVTYEEVAYSDDEFDAGLTGHIQRLRRQNQGISRWLALAVFAGAVAALLVINFLAQ